MTIFPALLETEVERSGIPGKPGLLRKTPGDKKKKKGKENYIKKSELLCLLTMRI